MIDSYAAARPENIVRFDREHFLKRVPRAVSFERPHFHFAETLAAELRLAAQGLLRDQRIRTDRTHVRLVLHKVVQFQHVNLSDHYAVLERLSGTAVVERRLAVFRQAGFLELRANLLFGRRIESRRDRAIAQFSRRPSRDAFPKFARDSCGK